MTRYDAVVVGSGPNGLSAAITLARAGRSVLVREGKETMGGGARSLPLTLPGYVHDICSTVHPLGTGSPFFDSLPLAEHGLRWVDPPLLLAHPLDDAPAGILSRSMSATVEAMGADGAEWQRVMEPFVARWTDLVHDALAPLGPPRHPLLLARFGLEGLRSVRGFIDAHLTTPRVRALFAAIAGHALVPLDASPGAAFGLVLCIAAHAVGWPLVAGGSQQLANALASYFRSLGGEIETGQPVHSLDELPPSRLVMLDITPRQLLRLAGDRLGRRYRRALERYEYGPGSFKMDWALSEPVPWRDPTCALAATVHVAGHYNEIVEAEGAAWRGEIAERPLLLVVQPTLFDPSRAPAGGQILWAYCHIPNGSSVDMTSRMEAQIERFAPGFRDVIVERRTMPPAALERHDANLVGGDVAGGADTLRQTFFRPAMKRVPYATSIPGVYLCSASTPPGGGVHGLCGHHAALAALRWEEGRRG